MDLADQIRALAATHGGLSPDQIDTANLFGKGRIEGDDASEFWVAFATEFAVDLSALRPYLHYDANEPPLWRTHWTTDAQGRRILDIPIGLHDLCAAAQAGAWVMPYPAHRLTRRPWALTPWALPVLAAALLALAILLL